MAAVARHYGITTSAAGMRLRRAHDYVAKMASAREAAQKSDKGQKDDEDIEITKDEEAWKDKQKYLCTAHDVGGVVVRSIPALLFIQDISRC